MKQVITLLIPLAGTSLGAAAVYFLQQRVFAKAQNLLLGFAAGVMMAASVWSLLIPAMEMAEIKGTPVWIPATVGFFVGIAVLALPDGVASVLCRRRGDRPDTDVGSRRKTGRMVAAVTLHNIPEGMAVGVAVAGALRENSGISLTAAMALSMGVALQNYPEGAIVSLPLAGQGMSRSKAFICGVLSGAVEPAAGFLTLLWASRVSEVLPYCLSFAAGAMMYVVAKELIPQAGKEDNCIGPLAVCAGFAVMMMLDVLLS